MQECVRQMPYTMAEPPSCLLIKQQEIAAFGFYIEDKSIGKLLN